MGRTAEGRSELAELADDSASLQMHIYTAVYVH